MEVKWNRISEVGNPTKAGRYLLATENYVFTGYWNKQQKKYYYDWSRNEDGDPVEAVNVLRWALLDNLLE